MQRNWMGGAGKRMELARGGNRRLTRGRGRGSGKEPRPLYKELRLQKDLSSKVQKRSSQRRRLSDIKKQTRSVDVLSLELDLESELGHHLTRQEQKVTDPPRHVNDKVELETSVSPPVSVDATPDSQDFAVQQSPRKEEPHRGVETDESPLSLPQVLPFATAATEPINGQSSLTDEGYYVLDEKEQWPEDLVS